MGRASVRQTPAKGAHNDVTYGEDIVGHEGWSQLTVLRDGASND